MARQSVAGADREAPPGCSLDGPGAADSVAPRTRLVAVVASEDDRTLGVPWRDVMRQVARRLAWVDPGFRMEVRSQPRQSPAVGAFPGRVRGSQNSRGLRQCNAK